MPARLETVFFYFGLTSFAVGSVVYYIYCPSIIRKYITSREFFNSDKEFYTHPDGLSWLLDDVKKKSGTEYHLAQPFRDLIDRGATLGSNEVNTLAGPMAAYFNRTNFDHQVARIFCFVFYAVGTAFVAAPTFWTFYLVGKSAFESISNLICTAT